MVEPQEACPGVEICFDGSGSHLVGIGCDSVEIVSWEWDLDDDGVYEESGQYVCKEEGYELPPGEPQHDYTVYLRVTSESAEGEIKSSTETAVVRIGTENHPPIALPGGPYTGCVGDTILLSACLSYDPDYECLGDSIVEYCWDFEPDGIFDFCTPACIPDTFLIYYEETYKYVQLSVKDTYGNWSDPASGIVEVWSSLRELWVAETDIDFESNIACDTVEICATVHAGTQEPDITIDPATVDIYYDDITDPGSRIARFTTPVMYGGDAVTFCADWALPDTLDHEIFVVVDPNHLIRECNETDNVAMRPMMRDVVCGRCDLARSWGYWKHQCSMNGYTEVPPEELAMHEEMILGLSSVFDECYGGYGCELILADPPNSDMLRKGAQQLYTLWLNIVSKWIGPNCEVDMPDLTEAVTVEEAVDDIETVLCDPGAPKEELERVKDLAEMLNNSGQDQVEVAFASPVASSEPGEVVSIEAHVVNLTREPMDLRITAGGLWSASASPAVLRGVQPFVPVTVMLSVGIPAEAVTGEDADLVTVTAASAGNPFIYEYEVVRVSAEAMTPADRTPVAARAVLEQNFPNPFNPSTTIMLRLTARTRVSLSIYNLEGKFVRMLVDGVLPAGNRAVVWDGRDARGDMVSSGVYLCRLKTDRGVRTKKMVLLR